MYIPIWALVVAALVFLVLLRLALFPRGGGMGGSGDMVEQQRRTTPRIATAEERALLARPDIAALIAAGKKIEAIRAVREASGLGLKEAKELVEATDSTPVKMVLDQSP
jgi:hypothetical protein